MTKSRIVILAMFALFVVVILFQLQTTTRLQRELDALGKEYSRLRENFNAQEQNSSSQSARADANDNPQQKRLQELQSEVLRLRDSASRALRAEAEVTQLRSALQSRKVSGGTAAPEAGPYLPISIRPTARRDCLTRSSRRHSSQASRSRRSKLRLPNIRSWPASCMTAMRISKG